MREADQKHFWTVVPVRDAAGDLLCLVRQHPARLHSGVVDLIFHLVADASASDPMVIGVMIRYDDLSREPTLTRVSLGGGTGTLEVKSMKVTLPRDPLG